MRWFVTIMLWVMCAEISAQVQTGSNISSNVVNYLDPTGMTQVMVGADDDMIKVGLGHDFSYYGGTFDTAWMSSNGFIMLYDEDTEIGNPNVLSTETYLTSLCCEQHLAADASGWDGYTSGFQLPDDIFSYMIGPLWSDLEDTSDEQDAGFYWSTSEKMTSFLWYNINEYNYDDSPQTFQLNLWAGGSFDFLYDMIDLDKEAAFIGFSGPTSLQSEDQTVYTQLDYSPYNEAYSIDDIDFTVDVNGGKEWYGADAGYSLDCSSALNFTQCPGYDAAYLDQQCLIDSQYSSSCLGYVDPNATTNSGLTEEEQCQINPAHSYNCYSYFSNDGSDNNDDSQNGNHGGNPNDQFGNTDDTNNSFGNNNHNDQGNQHGSPPGGHNDHSGSDMGMTNPNEGSFSRSGDNQGPGGPQEFDQGPVPGNPYQDSATVDVMPYTTQPEHNVDTFPAEHHFNAHQDQPDSNPHQFSNQNPPLVDVATYGGPEPDQLDVFNHAPPSTHEPNRNIDPIVDLELADLPDRVLDDVPSITREPALNRPEPVAALREPQGRDVEDEIRELEEPQDRPAIARVSRALEPVVETIEERAPVPTTQSAKATTSVAAAITKQQVTSQLNVAAVAPTTNSTDTTSQQFVSVDVSSVTTVAGISEQQDSSQDQQSTRQGNDNKQESSMQQDVAYVEQQNQQSNQHDGSQYNHTNGLDAGYQMDSEGLTQFGALEPTQMLQPFDNGSTSNTGEDAAAMAEQPSFGITDVTFEEKLTESIATGASIGSFLSGSAPDFTKFDVKPPNMQQKVDTVKVESLAEKMTEESVQENAQKMADQMQESGGFVDQTTAVVLININPMFGQYYNTTAQQQPSWYRSETIYKNNKTIDDSMSLYMMAGKSDKRHREMVLQQYGR